MTVRAALVVAVLCAFASGVWAITVDGIKEAAWNSPWTVNDDPNEDNIRDGYDIDYNYYIWNDDGTGNMYFAMQTYSLMSDPELTTQTTADFAAILLNTDNNSSTGSDPYGFGTVGAEYYMQQSLDVQEGSAVPVALYHWNGSGWDLVGNVGWMARNDNPVGNETYTFIEFSVDADLVGHPATFSWGGYIDNGISDPEDHCPDDWQQGGETPEPTSMALMLLGLPAMVLLRRRREGK
ncbi:PEP-CTERM sorting domain-containing protein [candidate division WOR-3 bacterium]|nr:PEP-CTERM sorting domain-containing protein [candidate division WOR-3 bacterium]